VKLIEKFKIFDDEKFRDFYMPSGFNMEEEYRRLPLAGHVVNMLMLEIPETCKQAVRRRGRWNCVKWRDSLLVSLNERHLPGQVVILLLANTSGVEEATNMVQVLEVSYLRE